MGRQTADYRRSGSKHSRTRRLVASAMMMTLTAVVTLIGFPAIGGRGYVNFGDAMVMCSAILIGGPAGMVAAGFGSALADLFLGYTVYMPATVVIKSLMAGLVWLTYSKLAKKKPKLYLLWLVGSGILAELWMVFGYFAYEAALFGSTVAVLGLPSNFLQAAFGVISGVMISGVLVKLNLPKLLDS